MDMGHLGGIVGSLVGLVGGIIGTYASISNTNTSEERSFMIKAAAVAWISITLFLVLLLTLPKPYNFLMWVPYGFFLPLFIIKVNRGLAELRQIDLKSTD